MDAERGIVLMLDVRRGFRVHARFGRVEAACNGGECYLVLKGGAREGGYCVEIVSYGL